MNTCWFPTKAAIVKSLQTNVLQKLKIRKLSEKSTAAKKQGKKDKWEKREQ